MSTPRSSMLISAAALILPATAFAVSMDWATVGNPGNPCLLAFSSCFGRVDYSYRISKHEVTNAQYAEFLNAVAAADPNHLYNPSMETAIFGDGGIARSGTAGSYVYSTIEGRQSWPVNFVSLHDAFRFANWMHNGQPTGAQTSATTEDGAYTMTAQGMADNSIVRNPDASVFVTTDAEWYKAGHYDPTSNSYYDFPFADGLDAFICEAPPGGTTHSANCGSAVIDEFGSNSQSDVGAYLDSLSPYGTFDQFGNVREWTETLSPSGTARRSRGGSFGTGNPEALAGPSFGSAEPDFESALQGFRVAAVVPEPSTGLLLAAGLVGLAVRKRGRRPSGMLES